MPAKEKTILLGRRGGGNKFFMYAIKRPGNALYR